MHINVYKNRNTSCLWGFRMLQTHIAGSDYNILYIKINNKKNTDIYCI